MNVECGFLNILDSSKSQNYTSDDITTERFKSNVINTEFCLRFIYKCFMYMFGPYEVCTFLARQMLIWNWEKLDLNTFFFQYISHAKGRKPIRFIFQKWTRYNLFSLQTITEIIPNNLKMIKGLTINMNY